MSAILLVVLVVLSLWDASGSAPALGANGIPPLSITVLLAFYLVAGLERSFVPILVTGLVLDFYGGMPMGAITLSLLLAFIFGDLIRGRWLRGRLTIVSIFSAAIVYLLFTLLLLLLELLEVHRLSLPRHPEALLIAIALSSVLAAILSSLFSPHREQLSVKGLE
jgi:hypothetical protein